MRILCLYNNECALPLFEHLKKDGHETVLFSDSLTKKEALEINADLTVSYTYRYILSAEVLNALNESAVNLHNSYLPWNRGSDANLWSILEKTPRGVSLHYMEPGLDKGAIITQKLVPLLSTDTLKSSYDALDKAAKEMFIEAFALYRFWPDMKKKPCGVGSYHSTSDGEFMRTIISSYDMPIGEFCQRVNASGKRL